MNILRLEMLKGLIQTEVYLFYGKCYANRSYQAFEIFHLILFLKIRRNLRKLEDGVKLLSLTHLYINYS